MAIHVSVLIPVYNKQDHIEQCIQSVLKQSIKKELEIICVDDGSTDQSHQILERLQKYDARLQIITQKNKGAGAARNTALHAATGEFVHFMDADDYYMGNDVLEHLYNSCIAHKVTAASGLFYMNENGKVTSKNIFGRLSKQFDAGGIIAYKNYQYDWYQYNFIFSRKLLLSNQIKFPEYQVYEDPPFCVKALYAAREFYFLPEPFYCYRTSQRSVNQIEKRNDWLKGLMDCLCFSAETGLERLHRLAYYRIHEQYSMEFLKNILEGDMQMLQLLIKANSAVKWEWIEEKSAIAERMLKPLQFVMHSMQVYLDRQGTENGSYEYKFPFQMVPAHAEVALYGAGIVGQQYYEQIIGSRKYNLKIWADINADKIENKLYKINCINELCGVYWDYVVIAVYSLETAMEIIDDLLAMGIPSNKIIWSVTGNYE